MGCASSSAVRNVKDDSEVIIDPRQAAPRAPVVTAGADVQDVAVALVTTEPVSSSTRPEGHMTAYSGNSNSVIDSPAPPVHPADILKTLLNTPASPRTASKRAAAISDLSGADSCELMLSKLWSLYPALDTIGSAEEPKLQRCVSYLRQSSLSGTCVADILSAGSAEVTKAAEESKVPAPLAHLLLSVIRAQPRRAAPPVDSASSQAVVDVQAKLSVSSQSRSRSRSRSPIPKPESTAQLSRDKASNALFVHIASPNSDASGSLPRSPEPLSSPVRPLIPLVSISNLLSTLAPISSDGRTDVYRCRSGALLSMLPAPPLSPSARGPSSASGPGVAPSFDSTSPSSTGVSFIIQHAVQPPLNAEMLEHLRARLSIPAHRSLCALSAMAHVNQTVYFIAPDASTLSAPPNDRAFVSLHTLLSASFSSHAANGPPSIARYFEPMHVALPVVFAQIASALLHLHVNGIRHGQVSVSNIFVACADEMFARPIAGNRRQSRASPAPVQYDPALGPSALLHNYWLTAVQSPPYARPPGPSNARAEGGAEPESLEAALFEQGDVWALAQCMCAVLAGSHTALARVQRSLNAGHASVGLPSSAVRTVAASHRLHYTILEMLEQCLAENVADRPSIDEVAECLDVVAEMMMNAD